MPGTERHPSSMSDTPVASTISGLTSTTRESRRSETSTTITCLCTSTWVAASPMPGAVYMVSVISAAGSGQPAQAPLTLKPDAPDRYVVVPGDTLWGISERYTDSPWRWPELWNMNKEQIQNPHLIYPGYAILLDRAKGTLTIARPGTEPGTRPGAAPGTGAGVRLSPRVRAEPLPPEEIPSIPASVIEPFLTRPLVIEPDGLDRAPTTVATQHDSVLLSAGHTA